jgi:hypothetical protein
MLGLGLEATGLLPPWEHPTERAECYTYIGVLSVSLPQLLEQPVVFDHLGLADGPETVPSGGPTSSLERVELSEENHVRPTNPRRSAHVTASQLGCVT